jgi:Glycosyltransferase family 87
VTASAQPAPAWLSSAAQWLTPNRIRAHAIVLALCLWGTCAVDFATPGLFDRVGNIKFQDFLQFYISARLIQQGRSGQLYDQPVADQELHALVGEHSRVKLPTVYGPQVGLLFVPLARLSFPGAARIWVAFSIVAIFACLYSIWKSCMALRSHAGMVILCAAAFPPLFHFFVRGQISAAVLVCFSAAFLAFRAGHHWLAGFALGFLVFKPQFLVAIPLILLLSQAWRTFAGLALGAGGQLAVTAFYFGSSVMQTYLGTMWHMSRWIGFAEGGPARIQMHSLRSFWSLLIPWPDVALALYILTSFVVVALAVGVWKSSAPLALRFSALTLAAVLANPHLFVYDLLVLAPVLLLLADWILSQGHPSASAPLKLLLYLAFLLPLFGPLSQWTHVQLSVLAFAALLFVLFRCATMGHKLDSNESAVV